MKRFFLIFLALLMLAGCGVKQDAFMDIATTTGARARLDPIVLLNGVIATGAGSGIRLDNANMHHTISTAFIDANTSVSAVTVTLEGTNDPRSVADASANWVTLITQEYISAEITAKQASSSNGYPMPYRRVRANLVTFTGGASPDNVTVRYEWGRP